MAELIEFQSFHGMSLLVVLVCLVVFTRLIEVCSHHLHSKPKRLPRVRGRAIPHDLERIVLDCLAKNPLDRPASGECR
jgi:hypothetical protein